MGFAFYLYLYRAEQTLCHWGGEYPQVQGIIIMPRWKAVTTDERHPLC